jgi:3-hydroxy-9,10-secoandrosta-1,3,5(10)-triene-9,17-dione monooxygenase
VSRAARGGGSATRDRAVPGVPAPEPGLSADELVARAAAMRDTLRSRQAECEALGRLPDATNREYVDAGFFRVLQPRRFGGYELGLEAFLRIAIELSRGCPSSGWVYALTAGHAHTVTMWPEQGQVELFGDGDFRCPFSNLPVQALAVDGGYRVDGAWDYGSGCDTATHFIGGIAVVDEPGGEAVDTRWAAFPRDAYTIIDNWDTLGMRGTGSRRVVVADLFVPEQHTAPSPNPDRAVVDFPGRGVHENPIYRAGTIFPLLVSEPAAVAVGIAQGAIDHYIELLKTRRQYGPASPLRRELSTFQRDLGRATALTDTAESALMQVAATWTAYAHDAAGSGIETTDEQQRRLLMICQQIVELSTQAVDTIFRSAGTSATRKGESIERCFRDVNMIRTHVTMQFERTWENVGQMRLGLAPGSFF